MKKIITAVIAAVTLLSCTGCSLKKDSSDTDNKQKISALKVGNPVVPEIEKEVIWETDRIRVSTEFFKRAETGLKIKIENKSNTDLELSLSELYIHVNGFTMTDFLSANVPAGETLFDTISFNNQCIRDADIDEIHCAEFVLEAEYDGNFKDKEKSDTIISSATSLMSGVRTTMLPMDSSSGTATELKLSLSASQAKSFRCSAFTSKITPARKSTHILLGLT